MKNGKLIALLMGVLVVLAGTFYTVKHLQDQENQAEATYGTEKPRVTDIVLKTLASGSVQPRQEILVKPQVSGIVRAVLVEAGEVVEAGDVLAEVMIVPDVAALSNAESRLARAQIALDDAETNHNRNADLLDRGDHAIRNLALFELTQHCLHCISPDCRIDFGGNSFIRDNLCAMFPHRKIDQYAGATVRAALGPDAKGADGTFMHAVGLDDGGDHEEFKWWP